MKIKRLDSGWLEVVDERLGVSFSCYSQKVAEERLLIMGYRKGVSAGCYIMPGDTILDEDPRA